MHASCVSGWGTVATRGRRLSALHAPESSCSSKLSQTEAQNSRTNGLGPWLTHLLFLVSIRAGRILTYLTRVHSYPPTFAQQQVMLLPHDSALISCVPGRHVCRHGLRASWR